MSRGRLRKFEFAKMKLVWGSFIRVFESSSNFGYLQGGCVLGKLTVHRKITKPCNCNTSNL